MMQRHNNADTTPLYKEILKRLERSIVVLDSCAAMFQENNLKPNAGSVNNIGHSIYHIVRIQHDIYRLKPELKPESVKLLEGPDADEKMFQDSIKHAAYFCQQGKFNLAVGIWKSFLELDVSPEFIPRVKAEINKIKNMGYHI